MTLVIAHVINEGIIATSDSKALTERKSDGNQDVLEDAQKIFSLGSCLVLAYGDGTDRYDILLKAFEENAGIYASYKGELDYDFCSLALPNFLKEQYEHRIQDTARKVGVVLVGWSNRNNAYRICVMDSGWQMFDPREVDDYYCGGVTKLANQIYSKQQNLASMTTDEAAKLARETIEVTANSHKDKVNKRVVVKLLDQTGVHDLI